MPAISQILEWGMDVQKSKNLISKVQSGGLTKKELDRLKEDDYDHPFLKDLIRKTKEQKPFYKTTK